MGIYEHYTDPWNWIDTLFLTISLVAIAFWTEIMFSHMNTISSVDVESGEIVVNKNFCEISRFI